MQCFRGHALRRGRYSETGRLYLLTTVTWQRRRLFDDLFAGRQVANQLREIQESGLASTLCWVLMPDHLHWLVQLEAGSLERVMQRLKSRSAKAVNAFMGNRGQVWQKGYHDRAVRSDEDVRQLARYIVANPLRAGTVRRVGEYSLWDAIWL
ncbi:transposase [Pseudomonas sp. JM0905a]|uniref:Transposase n=1 Tax=Metapseudomonas resinovorans TaxID=53412 RepID=A0ABT4XZI6_METRE|nr:MULTISPECIES: transposase [Pseudomonas]MBD2835893.1 transposase [Pseudomonas sp. JM0905a]MDA8481914.1 transposase [Pseudomonas resinovorans]